MLLSVALLYVYNILGIKAGEISSFNMLESTDILAFIYNIKDFQLTFFSSITGTEKIQTFSYF